MFTKEEMLESYKTVSFCRQYERVYEEGALSGAIPGFSHLALAEEATFSAEYLERGPEDWLLPNSVRDLSLNCLIFGIDNWTAEGFGRMTGPNKGMAGAGHLCSPEHHYGPCMAILGAEAGIATGIALAMKLDKKNSAVIYALGDGTLNEGLVSESLNMVATKKLPVVFVVRNNQFAMSMAVNEGMAVTPAQRMAGFGIPTITVDGEDVLAVRQAMRDSLAKAKQGQPCCVEVVTVRWTGHFVGDPQGYRDPEDKKNARNFDPLKKYREYLVSNNIFTEEELLAIDKENKEKSQKALADVLNEPVKTMEFIREENAKNLYA